MVSSIAPTWFLVLQAGFYEQDTHATRKTGDWNGDDNFNTTDFVYAFPFGRYDQANAVRIIPQTAPNSAASVSRGSTAIALDATDVDSLMALTPVSRRLRDVLGLSQRNRQDVVVENNFRRSTSRSTISGGREGPHLVIVSPERLGWDDRRTWARQVRVARGRGRRVRSGGAGNGPGRPGRQGTSRSGGGCRRTERAGSEGQGIDDRARPVGGQAKAVSQAVTQRIQP